MSDTGPRHPLRPGDRIVHIDGRQVGEIVELLPVDGLPGARVRWAGAFSDELLPLGYFCRAQSEDL